MCGCVIWQYLGKFTLAPVFTEAEFCHWFLPRQGIVDSYVVEVNCSVVCCWRHNVVFHDGLCVI